jgi:hypothetical protein
MQPGAIRNGGARAIRSVAWAPSYGHGLTGTRTRNQPTTRPGQSGMDISTAAPLAARVGLTAVRWPCMLPGGCPDSLLRPPKPDHERNLKILYRGYKHTVQRTSPMSSRI